MLTLAERADCYRLKFPRYPSLWVDKGWLMGIWVMGHCYARANRGFYGAYPGNYLARVLTLFPDATRRLELFSGQTKPVPRTIRLDLNPTNRPSAVGDAQALPFLNGLFDLVLADPPYSVKDAQIYGCRMIVRHRVLREVRRVVRDNGYLCWLDTVRPMYRYQDWQQIGAIGVLVSTNTRTRLLSIFQTRPRGPLLGMADRRPAAEAMGGST